MDKNNFVRKGRTLNEIVCSQKNHIKYIKKLEDRYQKYAEEFSKDDNETISDDTIVDEYYTFDTKNKKKILDKVSRQILLAIGDKEEELKCDITFDNFGDSESIGCMHYLINTGTELRCLCCGASTKDYNLTEDEFEILVQAASLQSRLFKDARLDNASYLKILLDKRNRTTPDYTGLSEMNIMEEAGLFYDDISVLNVDIRKANERDSDNVNGYYSEKGFIPRKDACNLLLRLSNELDEVKKSDSRFKELIIEEYKTAICEILILSGRNIPSLIESANKDDDMIALTKAYYNLSNPEFRKNSDYFMGKPADATEFKCVTANEKINGKILEITLRR